MRRFERRLIATFLVLLGFVTCSVSAVVIPTEDQSHRDPYGLDEEAGDRSGHVLFLFGLGLSGSGVALGLKRSKRRPGYPYPDWNR